MSDSIMEIGYYLCTQPGCNYIKVVEIDLSKEKALDILQKGDRVLFSVEYFGYLSFRVEDVNLVSTHYTYVINFSVFTLQELNKHMKEKEGGNHDWRIDFKRRVFYNKAVQDSREFHFTEIFTGDHNWK